MDKSWSFRESNNWENKYPKCAENASRVAPINIDTSDVTSCHSTCKLATKYASSKCYVINENSMPTVIFDPTCFCKFKGMIYTLKKMTIHRPSMHTINHNNYDMEILLYHYLNPKSEDDGGVILSILFRTGPDHGDENQFFNEFINQIPTVETSDETEIEVSENWSPEMIFPGSKSFFYYDGALPYPPCNPNWSIVVFEEVVPISSNIINTIKYILGDSSQNIRDVRKKPKNMVVFYNSYNNFEDVITDKEAETGESDSIGINRDETKALQAMNLYRDSNRGFFIENKLYIKGLLLTLILILIIYLAIKVAKYLVTNDIINRMIVKQIKKKEQRDIEKATAEQGGNAAMGPPMNMGPPQQMPGNMGGLTPNNMAALQQM